MPLGYPILIFLWLAMLIPISQTRTKMPVNTDNRDTQCRDRLGYFRTEDYKISTCTMCYFYLILRNPIFAPNKVPKFKHFNGEPYYLVTETRDKRGKHMEQVHPTLDNKTSIDTVCELLEEEECDRWKTCCDSAWKCCQHQLENNWKDQKFKDENTRQCPQTFDGWSCWESAKANTTVMAQCPEFLTRGSSGAYSKKTCLADGTWSVSTETDLEQTDYEQCIINTERKIQRNVIVLSIVLNVLGSLLLTPAIILFTKSRVLRKQQRIKIHVNLFLAILLTSVLNIVWDVQVRLDRADHTGTQSFLHQEQVLCKIIYVLHQFFRASTFFWMSCEGYFLHRLMVNAFLPPKHFYGYLIYGWGLPVLIFTTYAGVRLVVADDRLCWIKPLAGSARAIEWMLIFTPIAACLLANMAFFANILKLMLTKLAVHPDEPSKFRRATKATSMLVPLFGLHLFCFMYRPKITDGTGYDVYEIFSAIVLNSQGFVVSLLLFYCNTEVQSHVKSCLSHWQKRYTIWCHSNERKLSLSMTGSASRRTSVSSSHTVGVSDILTTDDTSVSTVLQTTQF